MLNKYDYIKFCECEKKRKIKKISILNYLMDDCEETPMWLMEHKKGRKVNFKKIIESRLFYFPCYTSLGQPLKIFNKTKSSHTFIYASSYIPKDKAYRELTNNSIRGYKLYDLIELQSGDLIPEVLKNNIKTNVNYNIQYYLEPYGYLAIYDRKSEYNEIHGAARIAVIILGGDPTALYDAIFVNNNIQPHILVLFDPGSTKCGNSCFGKDGLLNKLAVKTNIFPKYVYCAINTVSWDNYEKVYCVSSEYAGCTHFYLYKKKEQKEGKND